MGKIYAGVGNAAKQIKKIYVGVGGEAKAIQKIYAGVNNEAKLVWSSSWRDLYQQVEFIQGTGTQYINCGEVVNADSVMTVVFQLTTTSLSSGTSYHTGACKGTSNRFGVANNSNGNFIFGLGGGYHGRSANTNKQTVIINSPTKKITQNGTNRAATSGTYSTLTDADWLGILGSNNPSGTLTCGKVKIYHVLLEEGGIAVHDYYPVYRKSDSEPGVYDIITGQFFPNSGTGTITVGSNYEQTL